MTFPCIKPGDERTADVVPHAEDGARDGGQGIDSKVYGGEAGGEAGVLHAHLDRDSPLLRLSKS